MRPSLPGLTSSTSKRRSPTGVVLSTIVGVVLAAFIAFLVFQPIVVQTPDMLLLNSYKVEIIPAQPGIYEVWIPVPVDSESRIAAGFEDNIRIDDGDASVSLISTDHGPALKVMASGTVRISWVTDWEETDPSDSIDFLSMVMAGGSGPLMWAYCNQDHIEVKITLWSGHWYP